MLNIRSLIDEAKCFEVIRGFRWPTGVTCPSCHADQVTKQGRDETQPQRQRYLCKGCGRRFDDLTDTIFAGHHKPLSVWVLCLYLMGLNLSNQQIARELDLPVPEAQQMTTQLRQEIVERRPAVQLQGEVECDEVYIIAGHKGHPEEVTAQERPGRRNRLHGAPGRGTLEKEKPPVLGMLARGGQVVLKMLEDVKQKTIEPLLRSTIVPGSLVYTDEYNIYSRLEQWGYEHKSVCHSRGEYARDEDGDGFCEVHVNSIEGFWSLLRSWLRPHRGISQESLPLYLGFFEFVHNAKQRGKALLLGLLEALLS